MAGNLKTVTDIDNKKVLAKAGGGRVDDISRQVEGSLYQLKRQLGDIGNWWKDKLGIKRRGGFQR